MQNGDFDALTSTRHRFQELRNNLLCTAGWLNNQIRDFLGPFGITAKQYDILQILAEYQPDSMPIQQIRDRMIDKMSDTSRLVDRLIQKGLVEKIPCSHDRRSNRASITNLGQQLLKRIETRYSELDKILAGLQSSDLDQLNQLLNQVRALGNETNG